MHRSRQWIILTLLGLVGLGPMGSGELLAQTVKSVNIKQGGLVGIDDVFQVDVTVRGLRRRSEALQTVAVFLVALAGRTTMGMCRIPCWWTPWIRSTTCGLVVLVNGSGSRSADFWSTVLGDSQVALPIPWT